MQQPFIIGVSGNNILYDDHAFQGAGNKYLEALLSVANVIPMIIPTQLAPETIGHILERLDGVLLTGAVSNVHPSRYQIAATQEHEPFDVGRDKLTFALIDSVLARGMPLFCICRGHQELNVALGGSLDEKAHLGRNRLDHRMPAVEDRDIQYGPRHKVLVTPNGMLSAILEQQEITVNSLHRQCIHELSPRLNIEAQAPDGVIEATSVKGARGFALSVQWHPEYKADTNPVSVKLFQAFADAAKYFHNRSHRGM